MIVILEDFKKDRLIREMYEHAEKLKPYEAEVIAARSPSSAFQKELIDCTEDLTFDIAKEITLLGAEFISFGNRMNAFAARLLELDEGPDAA